MIFREVVADGTVMFLGGAEKQLDRRKVRDRGLGIEIELAERFDLVAKKLRANRQLRLPGIDIENPAANRELPARCHLRRALVAGCA